MGIFVQIEKTTVKDSNNYDQQLRYGWNDYNTKVFDSELDSVLKVFRSCEKNYGRCISSVFLNTEQGVIRTGWIFQKREEVQVYDTSLRSSFPVMVTAQAKVILHDELPKVETKIVYHYKKL